MFARDGFFVILFTLFFSFIIVFAGLLIGNAISWLFYLAALFLIVFTLYFFRDPDRTTPEGENLLISPADGKVIIVKEAVENTYLKGVARQVSIFLSPLDVHVNRNPVNGLLEYVKYIPGKYLVAWHEKSSELNERAEFGVLHNNHTRIFYKQIAGFVARRIVFHVKQGNQLVAGKRFGMMKFGSRMDILVPSNVKLNIEVDDRVVAGETVIGTIEDVSAIQNPKKETPETS
ncbi:MAG: phosphatidylserine decarboxylase family protein [Balneolales bacterium]